MPKFPITAEVRREILDNVSLTVEADTFQEALSIASEVLEVFPEAVDTDKVKYCYIDNRMYLGNEIISMEEDKYYA